MLYVDEATSIKRQMERAEVCASSCLCDLFLTSPSQHHHCISVRHPHQHACQSALPSSCTFTPVSGSLPSPLPPQVAHLHNKRVMDAGMGEVWEQRATDISIEKCKKRCVQGQLACWRRNVLMVCMTQHGCHPMQKSSNMHGFAVDWRCFRLVPRQTANCGICLPADTTPSSATTMQPCG